MTAPPIAPDVDVRNFPRVPIDRARLFGSAFHARANDSEWRAGVTLWLKSWDQHPSGSLPDDDVELCRLAEFGRDQRRWHKVKPMALLHWAKADDGRLYHHVVAEFVTEAWDRKSAQRHRTEAARAARWPNSVTDYVAETVKDTVTVTVTDSVAGTVTDSVAPPPNAPLSPGPLTPPLPPMNGTERRGKDKKGAKRPRTESKIEPSESVAAREGFSTNDSDLGRSAPLRSTAQTPPTARVDQADVHTPTAEEKAEVAALVEQATAALTGSVPKGIRDPAAYKAAVKESRFASLVRQLNEWVGTGLDGEARSAAWQVLAAAEKAGARSGMAAVMRRNFDKLVRMHQASAGLEGTV